MLQTLLTLLRAILQRENLIFVPDADTVSQQLNALAAARREFRRASAPLLEKIVLLIAAKLFNSSKRSDERDECAALFREMEEQYPGQIDWTVL